MKKRLIMSLETFTLTLAMSTSVFASALVVSIDGEQRVFTEAVETEKDVLVYADELADKIGVSYSYDATEKILTFIDSNNTMILALNKEKGDLNGEEVSLPIAPTLDENGKVLVPLNFICEVFGVEVNFNNESVENDFSTSYFSDINGLGEITENTVVYTYDEALEVLNENSIASQKGALGKEQIQETIDGLNGAIGAMQDIYTNTGYFDPISYNKIILAQGDLNESLDDIDEQIALIKTSNELQLKVQLMNLTKARTDYYLAEKNLEIEKTDLEITKAKNQLGMVSDLTLDKAEEALKNSEQSLKTLADAVTVEEQDLNALLRLPLDEDVFIEYYLEVEQKDYNLDKLVSTAIDKSLNVEQAREALKEAKVDYNEDSPQVEMARLDVQQAEEKVEKNVYSTYNNLITVMDNYKMVIDARASLIRDYELAEIQYELGYITKYDLNKIAAGVAKIDASILSLEMTYDMLTFQLDHPRLFGV